MLKPKFHYFFQKNFLEKSKVFICNELSSVRIVVLKFWVVNFELRGGRKMEQLSSCQPV